MAPPRKISPDQLEFLNSHVEGYLDCGSSRSLLTKFWTTVNAAFFAKWPERQSLIEKGILPTPSEVQLSDSERDVILGKAIKDRKKYIKQWFRNTAAGIKRSKPVIGKDIRKKFAQASKARRYRQPLEIYEQLHTDTITVLTNKMLAKIPADKSDISDADTESGNTPEDEDSDDEDSSTDSDEEPHERPKHNRRVRMKIRRRARKVAWEKETQAVKEEVNREWAKQKLEFTSLLKDGMLNVGKPLSERTPQQLQWNIDQIRGVISEVAENVYQLTGWTMVCLYGGPQPVEGGKIAVGSCGYGQDEHGIDFPTSFRGWSAVVDSYGAWLGKVNPHDIRESRALEPRSERLKAPEGAVEDATQDTNMPLAQRRNSPQVLDEPASTTSGPQLPQIANARVPPASSGLMLGENSVQPQTSTTDLYQLSPGFTPPRNTSPVPSYWRRRDSPSMPLDEAFPTIGNIRKENDGDDYEREREWELEEGLRAAEEDCRRQQEVINRYWGINAPSTVQPHAQMAIDPSLEADTSNSEPAIQPEEIHVPMSRPAANPLKNRATNQKNQKSNNAQDVSQNPPQTKKMGKKKQKQKPTIRPDENSLIASTADLRERYAASKKNTDMTAESAGELAEVGGEGEQDIEGEEVGQVYIGWDYQKRGRYNRHVITPRSSTNINPAGEFPLATFPPPPPDFVVPGRRSRLPPKNDNGERVQQSKTTAQQSAAALKAIQDREAAEAAANVKKRSNEIALADKTKR